MEAFPTLLDDFPTPEWFRKVVRMVLEATNE